ncbi:antibiotic biosynthesis monooxygenase family protein [Thalassospira lucentensis]|uniref:antibiotic biosynthesis monooxygenase family protein n=1 Tax=Thalassospira lucentensis TaxID=168935 RepID=UPI00399D5B75
MIYEIAQLPVDKQHTETFRQAFDEVVPLLRRAEGYQGHLLAQGVETPDLFHLIVRWRSLEDHTPGFEASEDHQTFMTGLEQYFSEEPQVYHIEGEALAASDHGDLSNNAARIPKGLWP